VRSLHARGKSTHGFSRVLLGQPYEEIRVRDVKVTFHPTISPRQAKYCDRTRTRRAVGVAVESAVEKYISRLDIDSAAKPGFDKRTGKNNACVTVKVQMTRRCLATRKHFKADASRFVFELRPHA
jgi:hypothetical protein